MLFSLREIKVEGAPEAFLETSFREGIETNLIKPRDVIYRDCFSSGIFF